MRIESETVRWLASLARLDLAEGEIDALVRELDAIVGHFEILAAGPGEAPPLHERGKTILRADEARQPPPTRLDELCPDLRHGLVAVPRVVSREGRDG